jgi:hypothetical protein
MAKRKKSRKRRRSYKGYGSPLKIYSGYGKVKVSLGMMLPSLVGGTGTLGATLLMRAFVPPEKKDDAGNPIVKDGVPQLSVFWKYAGLFGAGVGVLASMILGPFQGWGAAVAGSLTAVMAGCTAQFANMVVPKDKRHLAQYGRRLGAVATTPVRRGPRVNVMSGMGSPRGLGLVASQAKVGQPGRTGMFMPPEVIQQVNAGAYGQGNTGMGF